MAWRVILRFSLNRDAGSKLRNAIAGELRKRGFERTKTATWECADFDNPAEAMRAIREVTRRLESPPKYGGGPRVIMDHLWVYADQPRKKAPRVQP